jgi:hypothetical protein
MNRRQISASAARASVRMLACVAVIALAPVAFAADNNQSPNNPNCSPGVKGCTANYPTADITSSNPSTSTEPQTNPTCTDGGKGCAATAPTADLSKNNPAKAATQK